MDNRLFLTALVVTLSWMSLGSNAQVTTTGAGINGTTGAGNNGTTAGNNATTAGNNATTAAGNNATTAAGNNATTAAGNNATTAAGNNATTGAPPLTPNTTVEILVTPVSRAQCGKQQLCAAAPSQCDPSTAGSCFFLAAKQISGNNFEFGLSGVSNGYIAASLSPGSSLLENATTYVCANNGGVVKFFGTLFSKSQLIVTELNVNSVKGSVNGNKIQCTFAATVPTASTRAVGVALQIATGTFNSTSGTLGAPVAQFRGSVEDLGNPTTNVNNTISSSTIPLHRSMTQAMMITVAVLGLAML
ncbi:putative ferric-chelate reductase 1 isoform X2 [Etheostoma cragini]|uniref:putative ferric-chelate reductase 1 isoform X2 n=1 Tax=Etheostoma cragini TaxID=417921 RepID=UPI00155E27E8|nr:putative ferric-chelate reductase 1 isoform X2 [Etheostoma cragini]